MALNINSQSIRQPYLSPLQKLGMSSVDDVLKIKRLMIGTDGLTNTGKTEFILSAPGPKVLLPLDSSYDSTLRNPNPPAARDTSDLGIDGTLKVPMQGTVKQVDYVAYFNKYRERLYTILGTEGIRTVGIDGDSDSWELQVLAEFGKISQIPPMAYPMVDGARRAMIKRCWESGKIIIATNKIKGLYEDVLNDDGTIKLDSSGRAVQKKADGKYKRQGFRDQDYMWQIQIRHMRRTTEPKVVMMGPRKGQVLSPGKVEYGILLMKCKSNPLLEGSELWGDQCNFRGLVEFIYPNVDPEEWGLTT